MTSRESRLAIMFLPLWSTTPAFGCPDRIREPRERYAGTRAEHVRMHSSLPYRELQTWLATHS